MSAVAELVDQAGELRRRERLLVEALDTGLRGEQRRVQTALLRETRGELATANRALRAVEAGWEPFEPSAEWAWGYVEDPRFLKGRERVLSVICALPLAAAVALFAASRWDLLPTVVLGLVLMLGLQAVIHGVLGRAAEKRVVGEVRLFNAPMPAHTIVAYRRARESGLFDTFAVHSPRPEDFRAVAASEAPSLGLLDPVLAGRIDRHTFLIAQWDLAKDLAQV